MPGIWGGRRGLNPRHSVPQTDALPAELLPPLVSSLPCSSGAAEGGSGCLFNAGSRRASCSRFCGGSHRPGRGETCEPELVKLASGEEISIRGLPEQIRSLAGQKGTIHRDPANPDGQPRRCLDTRAPAEFGWKAKTTLRDGLRETIRRFESNARLAMRA